MRKWFAAYLGAVSVLGVLTVVLNTLALAAEPGTIELAHGHQKFKSTWQDIDANPTSGSDNIAGVRGSVAIDGRVLDLYFSGGVAEVGGGEGYGVRGAPCPGYPGNKGKKKINCDEMLELQLDHQVTGMITQANLGFNVSNSETAEAQISAYNGDTLIDTQTLSVGPGKVVVLVNFPGSVNKLRFKAINGTAFGLRKSTFHISNALIVPNEPPIAVAGSDQTVIQGSLVQLDGTNSSDPDDDALSYQWILLSRPTASSAIINNPTAIQTSFIADQSGEYIAQLVVNDGQIDSAPDSVIITVNPANTPPVANPGEDRKVSLNAPVVLDGSSSSDADNDVLSYLWSLEAPSGSLSILNNPTAATPSFTPDSAGLYHATLRVNDGTVDSAPVTVTITANTPPVADAGSAQTVTIGEQVTLDGSRSSDADNDALSYQWALFTPPGSAASLAGDASIDPGFTPDIPGEYQAELIVNDGLNDSEPASVLIKVSDLPPEIDILSPASQTLFNSPQITLSGWAIDNQSGVQVSVNGVPAALDGDQFSVDLTLVEGRNVLVATATDSFGLIATDSVTVVLDTDAPALAIEGPPEGAVLTSLQVDVVGFVNDIITGTTINGEDVQVTVNGVPAAVSHRSWLVEDLLLQRGVNVLVVTATDRAGNQRTKTRHVTVQDQTGQRIKLLAGNNQQATVGTALASPLVVTLVDAQDRPVADQVVTFKVSRGDGMLALPNPLSGFAQSGQTVAVLTDDTGIARVDFTLGSRAGAGNQRVSASAAGFVGSIEFCATALTAAPSKLTAVLGDRQTGSVNTPLALPFTVLVTDTSGNPVPNADVQFEVSAGGGQFAGFTTLVQTSDADGQASAILTLGLEEGPAAHRVSASLLSDPNLSVSFQATGKRIEPNAPTTVSGVVLDNQDNPMPNVTVHLELDGIALNPEPIAVTDEQGQFTVLDAPVGHVLLIADARTTTRPGNWPVLEFELTTVAGQDNTVGMPIWVLPFNQSVTIANGGPAQDVKLTMPDVPGAELTIAAHSVQCPHGQSECEISWTQVRGERVPMEPPLGSSFAMAGTLQPAGAHFDPPVAICIPNTGMPPGAQAEMYSFDHDLVDWVSTGTATIAPDGAQLCSDLGFGISKAGWHGCVPPPPPCTNVASACPPLDFFRADEADQCKNYVQETIPGQCPTWLCTEQNKPGACDDNKPCTVNDKCQDKACIGEPLKFTTVTAKANDKEGHVFVPLNDPETNSAYHVNFTAEQEGNCDAPHYEWNFGDGSEPQHGQLVSHGYEEKGTYEVTVTATCGECGAVSKLSTVQVTPVEVIFKRLLSLDEYKYGLDDFPLDKTISWKVMEPSQIDYSVAN